ncbi:hypothetical protein [Shewanella sp. TB7-MNA-CIBAN-0143]|uniref:hypothetical protein n=1 Tax=Shewanella sp. TB7-MNA-CIBAN-0143 TaxID=3140465 RepID=UPI00332444F9
MQQEQIADLVGDDLQHTEQSHFDEFAAINSELDQSEPVTQSSEYQPPQSAAMSGSELVFPVVSLACAVLAPSWNISDQEQAALADCYGALLDKYFPDVAESGGVEFSALIITAAILTPRLGTPRKPEIKELDKKEAADNEKAAN